MEVHRLITLLAGGRFQEAGTSAFDLDFAARFLLNVLDVIASPADDLGSQVEAADGFETNGRSSLLATCAA